MPEQKKSRLLTQDENELIVDMLGFKCQTMATTVIELYSTAGPNSGDWTHKETGVLCLVKDSNKRSYFFRLYCPVRKSLLWEHEIYNGIQYLTPTPYLHSFEAENCIAGFNFASEDEGKNMKVVLQDILNFKHQKRAERKNNRHNSDYSKSGREVNGSMNLLNMNTHVSIHQSLIRQSGKSGNKKLSKADIGEPHDFRHVSHVGWDPNKGFDLEKADDPQLKAFFTEAGVSETHLRDKETRDFIYDFINRNGGIEAVKEEMDPPPIPQRIKTAPPRPPTRTLGPPPPPPLRVHPPRVMPNTPKAEVITSEVAFPPPPPPPPPGPPPPPMMADFAPHPVQDHSPNPSAALMEELTKNRKQLKPLNLEREAEDRKPPPSVASDSRVQLMDQIREGFKLKPVNVQPNQNQRVPTGGLASALAEALAERSKVIYSDSSSTSDTDDADEEWD